MSSGEDHTQDRHRRTSTASSFFGTGETARRATPSPRPISGAGMVGYGYAQPGSSYFDGAPPGLGGGSGSVAGASSIRPGRVTPPNRSSQARMSKVVSGAFDPADFHDDPYAFNVIDDFNNVGAKYSEGLLSSADSYAHAHRQSVGSFTPTLAGGYPEPYAMGDRRLSKMSRGSYGPLPDTSSSLPLKVKDEEGGALRDPSVNHGENLSNVEVVTVPALGQEYTETELKRMSRAEKKKKKRKAKVSAFNEWRRGEGQRRICGIIGPREAVFVGFFLLVCIAVVLYFTIPRTPGFSFLTATPFAAVDKMNVSQVPANFSMNMNMQVELDASSNWLPLRFTSLDVEVHDLNTNMPVGKGGFPGSQTIQGRKKSPVDIPVLFSYTGSSRSDQTWQDFYQACGHKYPGHEDRPGLNLRVLITMKIAGLIGTKEAGTQISSAPCPFELDPNQ